MHERIEESRRWFLKQTSFGVAGLALTGNGYRIFSADQPLINQDKSNSEFFDPVRYRPMAARVTGLKETAMSLNGTWRIDPKPVPEAREHRLDAVTWGDFRVPGQ